MWSTAGAHTDGWNKTRENKVLRFCAELLLFKISLPKPFHLFICRCNQRGLYCSKNIHDQFNIKRSHFVLSSEARQLYGSQGFLASLVLGGTPFLRKKTLQPWRGCRVLGERVPCNSGWKWWNGVRKAPHKRWAGKQHLWQIEQEPGSHCVVSTGAEGLMGARVS